MDDIVVLEEALPPMELLRLRVSQADASLKEIFHTDPDKSREAVLDLVQLLTAAKLVVLDA